MKNDDIRRLAKESGLTFMTISSRTQSHPEATEEQLKLCKSEWSKLWRKDEPYWWEYTTKEGTRVDLRKLADEKAMSVKTLRSRMYRAKAAGKVLTLEELTVDNRGKPAMRMFRTPQGILTLKEIAELTGVSYENLLYRTRKHPDITYRELICAPAVYHYKNKKPKQNTDCQGYSWKEIRQWYLDRGRHCSDWENIVRDLLADNPERDIKKVIERLKGEA